MVITDIQTFSEYYERIRSRTSRVIEFFPPDKIEWTYQPGKFTLGDLVRHIACIERYMYGETLLGKPSRYNGCGTEYAEGYENVVQFFNDLHRESMDIFSELSNHDLQKKCLAPGGHAITTWKWLRALVEHEVHHRGQIYTYLSMLGVKTPPLYGLTSEQVIDLSSKS